MATIVNIEIDQGSSKTVEYDWIDPSTRLPIDLTGYTAKMQVRATAGGPAIFLDYNTSNGKIVLGGVTGTITIIIAPADTTTFTVAPEWRRAVYDLFITKTADGSITMVARGEFTIMPRVTI